MPELPEVETVKETLKKYVLHKKITNVGVYYNPIIEYPSVSEFKKNIINQTINDIKRKGKWLLFILDDYVLLSHLRMEGKYISHKQGEKILPHEHIAFQLDDKTELRYHDTRKFGKMHLIEKDKVYMVSPLNELGLEPWDENLTVSYLKEKYHKKRLPIKTVLLDQSIITGIGNIYADEILFKSHINPLKKAYELNEKNIDDIINNTRVVLENAIKCGGTTIRSYTNADGIHGLFQRELLVHSKEGEKCINCETQIVKIWVGGRGTYYCPTCQK